MNKKGFTLIELLAVIIILGILMIIAIPSVTKYISDSRKSSYISTAKEVIAGARNLVNEGKSEMFDTDTTYYIDINCIKTENGTQSPYGEFTKAYVVVNYDGKGYEYYWTSVDDAGQGIKNITKIENLDNDKLESDLTDSDISNTVGVNGRGHYMIIDKNTNCGKGTTNEITDEVSGEGGPTVKIEYPEGKNRSTVSVADIIKVGTEEFILVKRNNGKLVLLARYNLKVGNKYDSSGNLIGQYNENDDGYGLQSSALMGCTYGGSNGSVSFSNTNYWNGKIGTTYPGNYCYNVHTNCANIFDSNSNLYNYVMNYGNYLKSIGLNIKTIRLLSLEEAYQIFDAGLGNRFFRTCFWLSNPSDSTSMRIAHEHANYLFVAEYNKQYGVRPIIEI